MLELIMSARNKYDFVPVASKLRQEENICNLIDEMTDEGITFKDSFNYDIQQHRIKKALELSEESSDFDINQNLFDRFYILKRYNPIVTNTVDKIISLFTYDKPLD